MLDVLADHHREQLCGLLDLGGERPLVERLEGVEAVVDELVDERDACLGVVPVAHRLARRGVVVGALEHAPEVGLELVVGGLEQAP